MAIGDNCLLCIDKEQSMARELKYKVSVPQSPSKIEGEETKEGESEEENV